MKRLMAEIRKGLKRRIVALLDTSRDMQGAEEMGLLELSGARNMEAVVMEDTDIATSRRWARKRQKEEYDLPLPVLLFSGTALKPLRGPNRKQRLRTPCASLPTV